MWYCMLYYKIAANGMIGTESDFTLHNLMKNDKLVGCLFKENLGQSSVDVNDQRRPLRDTVLSG